MNFYHIKAKLKSDEYDLTEEIH